MSGHERGRTHFEHKTGETEIRERGADVGPIERALAGWEHERVDRGRGERTADLDELGWVRLDERLAPMAVKERPASSHLIALTKDRFLFQLPPPALDSHALSWHPSLLTPSGASPPDPRSQRLVVTRRR